VCNRQNDRAPRMAPRQTKLIELKTQHSVSFRRLLFYSLGQYQFIFLEKQDLHGTIGVDSGIFNIFLHLDEKLLNFINRPTH
jgi:hypothetical protein